ncbi:TetR/AcrR family transcriptional regulator C-terminal domain-containing protein [Hydromonas duriensis]|uniref:TetR family transcriptional regulator n=1 Tax=Hydromonas duriensis TaxID=1527608 RepID=A0A4V3DK84_9BURK|nr:TetR/AcrR family transcriptional regulator C-terminal domain-containing protein [Hydromonas duriensis]TDR33140.1 TetR family transcriptional regulator [Hydromonas duriensis]
MSDARQKIIQTALALLDEVGLEGLTMRGLASKLCIQAPSLYWHFKNKQELLNAMMDSMLMLYLQPSEQFAISGPWQVQIHARAKSLRSMLLSHRDGVLVFCRKVSISHNSMRVMNDLTQVLLDAGFKPKDAARCVFSLWHYVIGFVLEEQKTTGAHALVDLNQLKQELRNKVTPEYSGLFMSYEWFFDADIDARFEFGIQLLLSGLALQS